jgi:hypothetical protein
VLQQMLLPPLPLLLLLCLPSAKQAFVTFSIW